MVYSLQLQVFKLYFIPSDKEKFSGVYTTLAVFKAFAGIGGPYLKAGKWPGHLKVLYL